MKMAEKRKILFVTMMVLFYMASIFAVSAATSDEAVADEAVNENGPVNPQGEPERTPGFSFAGSILTIAGIFAVMKIRDK